MSFYKELLPFVDYVFSVRKLQDYLSFDLVFPIKWALPKLDDTTIPFQSEDEKLKGISFVCQLNEKEVDLTIGKIQKIIKINKEREVKEKLFRETIEKLKKTFEETDLDKLQSLYFDFETETSKPLDYELDAENTAIIGLAEEREEQGQKRTRVKQSKTSSTDENSI